MNWFCGERGKEKKFKRDRDVLWHILSPFQFFLFSFLTTKALLIPNVKLLLPINSSTGEVDEKENKNECALVFKSHRNV
ncbi:CLUMA_CG016610, isoform A [Clunio marinus]|uniref:CLUMA_CG016610, isoform A n=1 Tax=Clunio marinus TaxID=568069 RepID=A0A1J1ITJ5_9DIPT|nr:CLUMA_CG016610, isoform A [Clunio marinus]